jgi:sugar phosphate isomerase/epimerase
MKQPGFFSAKQEMRMAISRREFFAASTGVAVAGLLADRVPSLDASPLGLPIGSQTWPHRAALKQDLPGVLKQLADLGVRQVELCSPIGYEDFAFLPKPAELKRILADQGLACESSHFTMKELREAQPACIGWAKEMGITQIITATLDGPKSPTMDDVKKAADEYNRIAAVSAAAGLQQGLHNEGFEVSTVDGRRTYDVLLELLDPKLVKLQFQMSTIRDGFVAADYFTKYPGRFYSMHLQDWNAETRSTVAVGKGSIDWKKTFTAAKTGGVKNYFVEQNMDMTKQGVAYLKSLNV